MEFHKLQQVLDAAREGCSSVRITNFSSTSAAWISLQLSKTRPTTHWLICPDRETAEALYTDLNALQLANPTAHLLTLGLFPDWETHPHSGVQISRTLTEERAGALRLAQQGLEEEGRPTLLISWPSALLPTTISREFFKRHSLQLQIGNEVTSLQELSSQLIDLGYLRVDPVEDPGTFSIRGEILDLYIPGEPQPHRIEFFGTSIEKIRLFNPTTQQTTPGAYSSSSLWVSPAREFIAPLSLRERILETIKNHADHSGIQRNFRDPLLSSLKTGVLPEKSEFWSYFIDCKKHSALSFSSHNTLYFIFDLTQVESSAHRFLDAAHPKGKTQNRWILPDFSELYFSTEDLLDLKNKSNRLYLFDSLGVSAPGSFEKKWKLETTTPTLSKNKHIDVDRFISFLDSAENAQRSVFLFLASKSTQARVRHLLSERDPALLNRVTIVNSPLSHPLEWPDENLVFLNEFALTGRNKSTKGPEKRQISSHWTGVQDLVALQNGDLVVHKTHGIGRYLGLSRLDLNGSSTDFIGIEYSGKDKLYLPVYKLDQLHRYHGASGSTPLDRLGGTSFERTKERVRGELKALAIDLVKLYAERRVKSGVRFSSRDEPFIEFEDAFPFDETPDQSSAIEDVLSDLSSGKIMDRLICGDVGFGKTEVAIRAAYRTVLDGKQVAVLVPTTILAYQHELSFKRRLNNFPVHIESLSRFKPKKEQRRILGGLASGSVDIIIGTHRLLSSDVKIKDLGLLIIDEEHRFGVEHKEKLKELKVNTHSLTLTATPIPRTLQMCMSGLRDISIIGTPPVHKLPIKTYVVKYDEETIQQAILFELGRGGQVFIVHNRVQTIVEFAAKIRDLVPAASVEIAHGQLDESVLENIMLRFFNREFNVLVCSTIIESGLDLPSANTIIINRADLLGLAQLYQIRGRVGRGDQRGYAYLLIPDSLSLSQEAQRRLEVIQRFVELGSGFAIASHDLELRGGGNLLGAAQSGHIAALGLETYSELLEEAIQSIKNEPVTLQKSVDPEIKIPVPCFIPETYVPEIQQRLSWYRKLSAASTGSDLDQYSSSIQDRYGSLPGPTENLFGLLRIKLLLRDHGVLSLAVGERRLSFLPGQHSPFDPVKTVTKVASNPQRFELLNDSRILLNYAFTTLDALYFTLERVFNELRSD